MFTFVNTKVHTSITQFRGKKNKNKKLKAQFKRKTRYKATANQMTINIHEE